MNPGENQPTADHTTDFTRRLVFPVKGPVNFVIILRDGQQQLVRVPTQPNRSSHRAKQTRHPLSCPNPSYSGPLPWLFFFFFSTTSALCTTAHSHRQTDALIARSKCDKSDKTKQHLGATAAHAPHCSVWSGPLARRRQEPCDGLRRAADVAGHRSDGFSVSVSRIVTGCSCAS